MKISRRSLSRFRYFSTCEDSRRLPEVEMVEDGFTAAECFHSHETFGTIPPCREPIKLMQALNGKEQHGLNVTHLAEDYIGRILFACEIRNNYPAWVQKDILGRARQIARQTLSFVPTFVITGEDFTTAP
jgi:hypothetical protein